MSSIHHRQSVVYSVGSLSKSSSCTLSSVSSNPLTSNDTTFICASAIRPGVSRSSCRPPTTTPNWLSPPIVAFVMTVSGPPSTTAAVAAPPGICRGPPDPRRRRRDPVVDVTFWLLEAAAVDDAEINRAQPHAAANEVLNASLVKA